MITISVPDKIDSTSRVTLSGKDYFLRFCFNPTFGYWSFGLYDASMSPLLPMVRVVPMFPLLHFYKTDTDLPDGILGCFSTTEDIDRDAFKDGVAKFVYIPNSELEGWSPNA